MKIIQYTSEYKEQVQKTCISQSTSRFKDEKAKLATLALYCDEYLDRETAFLLLNDEEEVVGYILCAKDLREYDVNMQPYLGVLKELDEEKYARYAMTNKMYEPVYPDYPAHLHIDIQEAYTHSGYGTELMHTLFEYLKKNQVPGICVAVDPDNTRAVRFYTKMGFVPYNQHNYLLIKAL